MTAYSTQFASASSQYLIKSSGVTGLPTGSNASEFGIWVNLTTLPAVSNAYNLISYGTASSLNRREWFLNNTSGTYQLGIDIFGASIFATLPSAVAGVWTYLSISVSGTTIKFYQDGYLFQTSTIGSTPNTTLTALSIGSVLGGSTYYANAKYYDARIYNKTLTDVERLSNRSGNITTTGMVFRGCIDNTPNDSLGTNNLTNINGATYVNSAGDIPSTPTINFDASSKFAGAAASPTTLSHTCTGSSRGLLVKIWISNSATVSAITYAGVAMTQVSLAVSGTERYYVFRLENPASGANNISVTPSSTSSVGLVIMGQSWTGVNQSNMVGGVNSDLSAIGSTTSITSSITPSSQPTVGFWFAREYNGRTITAGANTVYIDQETSQAGIISACSNESINTSTYSMALSANSATTGFIKGTWGFIVPAVASSTKGAALLMSLA